MHLAGFQMRGRDSLVLMEQFLQLTALIEAQVVAQAHARSLSQLEARTLLCLARLAADGAEFSMPKELCAHTGYPKNRIAEALGRLRGRALIEAWGTGTADGRTRAFRVTDDGKRLAKSLVSDLQGVELGLRRAMRTLGGTGWSQNLSFAVDALVKLAA
jgi:DNA-binding MarR family transcriptional regulator